MSVCCRIHVVRSVAAVPPWELLAPSMPLSCGRLDPKWLLPLFRKQIPRRNRPPRDEGTCMSCRYKLIVGTEQLAADDYKRTGCWIHNVSAFRMFSVPALRCWVPGASEGCWNRARGEAGMFCAVQRHPLVYLSKKLPWLKMCTTAILTSGSEIGN